MLFVSKISHKEARPLERKRLLHLEDYHPLDL